MLSPKQPRYSNTMPHSKTPQTPECKQAHFCYRETADARQAMQRALEEAEKSRAEAAATKAEAEERQRRFLALNGGWKRKEEALAAAASAAEAAAADARATAAEASARAEDAVRVRISFLRWQMALPTPCFVSVRHDVCADQLSEGRPGAAHALQRRSSLQPAWVGRR